MARRNSTYLLRAAMVKARSLRSAAAGPRHLLLVLLDSGPGDPAHRALAAAGISADKVRGVTGRSRRRGVSSSPALIRVDGFAQGLATGRGDRPATTTDHLVALCWHPELWLDDRDPRRAIVRTLKAEGAALPPGPLPRWDRTRFTQRIEIARAHLDAAIALLAQRYPVGRQPRWGFNYRAPGTA